ncbi:MAG: hypothetical protein IPK13_20980 [Deltaproteobacteria bacterium]|nr:hypothetical protein [Deltaproteobacteria bacterium]
MKTSWRSTGLSHPGRAVRTGAFVAAIFSSHCGTGADGWPEADDENVEESQDGLTLNVSNWHDIPVFTPNSTGSNMNQLFEKTLYSGALAKQDINIWYARTAFARTFPNAGRVKLPGLTRNYIGVPWQPRPFINYVTGQGYLIELEVESTGAVVPFGVLDVYGMANGVHGLYSTGAMKNPSSPTAPAPGATAQTWGGPLWPETSKFPRLLPLLPSQILLPDRLGQETRFTVPWPGRATDNWAAFIGMSNAVSRGAAPAACQLKSEGSIGLPIASSTGNTIHALRKINLGGNMGVRWVLIYSNYDDVQRRIRNERQGGIVEYFGIDLAPGSVWPGGGPPTYGRVLYGQQVLDGSGKMVNWSLGLWNRTVPRTRGGRIFNCSTVTPVVDVTL